MENTTKKYTVIAKTSASNGLWTPLAIRASSVAEAVAIALASMTIIALGGVFAG